MKILHTISSMGLNAGGPTFSTWHAVKGLNEIGIEADVLTFQVSEHDKLVSSDSCIYTVPFASNSFTYSSRYRQFLEDGCQYDLYHIHGIWQYPSYITPRIAHRIGKPYIITPHGMLYPQDLAKGKWKKHVFMKLFLEKDLQHATCIHATCMEEMQHIRALGVKSPIAVIPNPIDISDIPQKDVKIDKRRFGYLGRVHPRKNVERLIYAWHRLADIVDNAELVIIGDGDRKYMHFLKQEVQRLSLTNVAFTGFLSGQEKEDALSSLSYLVVPSDFENFGMIIPEAFVKGIPVIASKGTPWEELNTCNCGWWVDNDVDTITSTMHIALQITETQRQEMGMRGRKLISDKYTVEIVADQMERLYRWILQKGEKPEFVYTII